VNVLHLVGKVECLAERYLLLTMHPVNWRVMSTECKDTSYLLLSYATLSKIYIFTSHYFPKSFTPKFTLVALVNYWQRPWNKDKVLKRKQCYFRKQNKAYNFSATISSNLRI